MHFTRSRVIFEFHGAQRHSSLEKARHAVL